MIVLSGQFTYMRKKEDPIVRKFILSAQRFFVNLNISGEKTDFFLHFCTFTSQTFSPIGSLRWNPGIFDNGSQYRHLNLDKLAVFVLDKRSN